MTLPRANRRRLNHRLEELSTLTEPNAPGWTRRVFSKADEQARDRIRGWMEEAGLRTTVDSIGNVTGDTIGFGQTPGIVSGSHCDTVLGGGRFDGMAGTVAALEVAELLREGQMHLTHPYRAVCFLGEEPNEYGLSCVGSRAVAGHLTPGHLVLTDPSGLSLGERLGNLGLGATSLQAVCWDRDEVGAFVELHIEQGPMLEATATEVGIVTAIAGISRFRAVFVGRADHAGTMPMDMRRDALCGAADAIGKFESIVRATDAVVTFGKLSVRPGAVNVVPDHVVVDGEMRSIDPDWLADGREAFDSLAQAACRERSLAGSVEWLTQETPVPTDAWVRAAISRACADLGVRSRALPSMAGHDAVHMSALGPIGMIFVPSRDGRSHCADEWTDIEQLGAGVDVLARAIVGLDTDLGTKVHGTSGLDLGEVP